MRTKTFRPVARLSVLATVWCVGQGSAFAAGGYHAKPPTTYRGRCELTSPMLPSRQVENRCVAVSRIRTLRR